MDNQVLDNTITVTDGNFDQDVLRSETPVLVDFWADWCGPCKALNPTVKALADDYQGRLRVAKVNVDENPAVAARYGIRSIPTLVLFKDGKSQQTTVGVQSKDQLSRMIDSHF